MLVLELSFALPLDVVMRPYMERWALTSFKMKAIQGTVRRESIDCIRRES
jgi:hypothetical protein